VFFPTAKANTTALPNLQLIIYSRAYHIISAQTNSWKMAEAPQEPASPSRKMRSNSIQRMKDNFEKQCRSYGPRVFEDAGAFEAALDNKPIFTRALLEKAAVQVEIVRKGETDPDKQIIYLPHLLGDGQREVRIPRHPSPAVRLGFSGVFIMASVRGNCSAYTIQPCREDSQHEFSEIRALKPDEGQNTSQQELAQSPSPKETNMLLKALETCLLRSRFWASVREQLDALPVRVENIVCVALGTLLKSDKEEFHRSASQHVFACAIANYLSRRYAAASSVDTTPTPIPIVARDPSYALQDMIALSHRNPPITVVSEPYQYLSITSSTLLMSLYQPSFVPVFQVAADMTFPTSPAAIISTEILSHPWHKEGKMAGLDGWTPRVGRMLDQMGGTWLGVDGEAASPSVVYDNEESDIAHWGNDLVFYARKE
jgi:hypothetical protein